MVKLRCRLAALLLLATSLARAGVLTKNPSLAALVPPEAYQGVGTWSKGDYFVSTGHSIDITSLGTAKGKKLELASATQDAKRRLALKSAVSKQRDLDPDCYSISLDIKGFETAATYTLAGHDGLFLIGVARKDQVHVQVNFSPLKAGKKARALFNTGQYEKAAKLLAQLTQHGVQDPPTIALAHAASWQVNLKAGVTGQDRAEALNGLGHYYYDRGDYESSIRQLHALYMDTPKPSRQLLHILVDLCDKTHRTQSAKLFKQEINRRWPPPPTTMPASTKDSDLSDPYVSVLANDPILFTEEGAAVIDTDEGTYFLAIGSAPITGSLPIQQLQAMRIARTDAQRQAVDFIDANHITVRDKGSQTTVITTVGKTHSATFSKSIDETILVKVKGAVRGLPEVGSWESADGTVFFVAMAQELK